MAENGRKWWKMVENGFPRVSRHGHQGGQAGNGRKWLKMAENGLPRLFKWQKMGCRGYLVGNGFPRFLRHGSRGSQAGIGEHRHWAKHIKNFTPSKIRKFFLPLFWPFMRSWHFGADFGTPPQLTGVQGQLSFSRWGYRGDFGFRVFYVILLLLQWLWQTS